MTTTAGTLSTEALHALWDGFQHGRFDGGLYDLGDLSTDLHTGAIYLSRPGEMKLADAEAGAWILRSLGFAAQASFEQPADAEQPACWTIKIRRWA
jgi:hypothetical protein